MAELLVSAGIFKRLWGSVGLLPSFLLHQHLSLTLIQAYFLRFLFLRDVLILSLISDSLFRYTQDVSSSISQSLLSSEPTLTQQYFISILSFHYGLYKHSL
jgi:hypothetical protein